jgi:hypothetical protein
MPLDDGCRFDHHHGVEDLRPDPVKPNPEQSVGGEEPRAAGALPTQDGHLVSQSNKLELQRSAAAYPEREQGSESGQKGDHAHDGMGRAQETLQLVGGFDFCAGTGGPQVHHRRIALPRQGSFVNLRCAPSRLHMAALSLLRARMPHRAVIADIGTLDERRRYGSRNAPRASIPDDR